MSSENSGKKWSRGLVESVECCPACGSARREARRYSRHDDNGVMADVWHVFACANCGSLYLDPRPDAESLPRAYLDYYTHQAEDVPEGGAGGPLWSMVNGYLNRRFGMRRTPSSKLGAWVFSAVEPLRLKLNYYGRHLSLSHFPRPGRLLDVGCGNGTFLKRAREMGWQVTGCEPDSEAVATCRAQGLEVICGDAFSAALDGHRFDVVTISHVIEHVIDMQALLRRCKALLHDGGMLWVALPNPRSLGLALFGAGWRGLHVPFHLCIPSQHQLRIMMLSAHFCSIKTVRRGAHCSRHWTASASIARREQLNTKPQPLLHLMRIITDFVSTFTSRFGDETVMIARNSEANDAD